jgi:hypothetical protein
MRCRGEKPQEREFTRTFDTSVPGGTVDGPARVKLWSRAKFTRGFDEHFTVLGDLGRAETPRRPTSRGAKVTEGSSTDMAIPRILARL